MIHDPMCPFKDMGELNFIADDTNDCWGCRLVAEVRQEERNRSDLYMQGYADGREDAKELSDINAQVYYNYGYDDGYAAAAGVEK